MAIHNWQGGSLCHCRSWSDQELNAGLPLHTVPQPELEASVVTTFLMETVPQLIQMERLTRAQAWFTLRLSHPGHQALDGTQVLSQNWRGCMCSKPRGTTGMHKGVLGVLSPCPFDHERESALCGRIVFRGGMRFLPQENNLPHTTTTTRRFQLRKKKNRLGPCPRRGLCTL